MKNPRLGAVMAGLALMFGLAACTNPYDPGQRAVGGGLIGAGTGAAIGAAAGGGRGAAIGAAVGGATGAVVGAATTPPSHRHIRHRHIRHHRAIRRRLMLPLPRHTATTPTSRDTCRLQVIQVRCSPSVRG